MSPASSQPDASTLSEADWLASLDPVSLLDFLGARWSVRKVRLFACACVRRHWGLLTGRSGRLAIERAEAFVDRLARRNELNEIEQTVRTAAYDAPFFEMPAYLAAAEAAAQDIRVSVRATLTALQQLAYRTAVYGGLPGTDEEIEARAAAADERRAQTVVLRELAGNPFRPVVADLAWLSWNEQCVPKLARAIYEARSWEQFPILADALEDSGCRVSAVIDHCRTGADHYRGCWVLDLLLRKR